MVSETSLSYKEFSHVPSCCGGQTNVIIPKLETKRVYHTSKAVLVPPKPASWWTVAQSCCFDCFSLFLSRSATTFTSFVLNLWCLIRESNKLFGFSSPQKAHLFTNIHMHVHTHMQTHNCILVIRALRDPLKTTDTGLRTLLQVMPVRPKGYNNHMQGMNHIPSFRK